MDDVFQYFYERIYDLNDSLRENSINLLSCDIKDPDYRIIYNNMMSCVEEIDRITYLIQMQFKAPRRGENNE